MFGQQGDQQDNNGTHSEAALVAASEAVAQPDDAQSWQHPGQPIDQPTQVAPSYSDDQPQQDDQAVVPLSAPAQPVDPAVTGDLIDIKQQALSQLSPLVSHLDQSPEEKFRTTMMMIQATDDQSLVKTAYTAAGQIQDEKTRAQALLDIVNEINYFTSQHPQS